MNQSHERPFTKTLIKNLERLATYLESLPKGYKDFDMSTFVGRDYDGEICSAFNSPKLEHYARYNGSFKALGCGSVACAVGHGPSAGLFVSDSYLHPSYHTGLKIADWNHYAAEMFTGANIDRYGDGPSDYDTRFEWMFGGDWSRVDNHHWGAAARIRYLIANGGMPPEAYLDNDLSPKDSDRRLYSKFRIKKVVPLKDGFYTKKMLRTFEIGERKAKKEFLINA